MVGSETVKLTPSLVTALRQCGHRELWLRRQGEVRSPFVETAASARGKSLHATLAEFHRLGGTTTYGPADLRRLLARFWVREGYPDAEEEHLTRLRCEEELDAYYATFGAEGGTLDVERSSSLYRDLNGVRTEWFGRLDWLRVHPEGGLEVVDWKTHGRVADPEALALDPVTTMYGRLARTLAQWRHGWQGGPVRFSLLYVSRLEKVTVTLTREMVQAAEAELADLARGLQDGSLDAAEGPWCFWGEGCGVRAAGECPLFPPVALEGEW